MWCVVCSIVEMVLLLYILYVLFLGDGVKCRAGHIIRLYVGMEKSARVKQGKVNSKEFLQKITKPV
jgi:hypothetical protein